MAASAVVTMDIAFDHKIEGSELLRIIKEGLKHLLFIRRQLPLPLVLLQRERDMLHHRQQVKQGESLGCRFGIQARKRETAILAIEDTIDALDDFAISRKIHAMAILMGSTVVSPKEIFLLRPAFETLETEENKDIEHGETLVEESISFAKRIDKSGRNFVKNLVTNKHLASLGSLRPTNVYIFVLAARDTKCSNADRFLPKQSYQLPYKGKYYDIVLTDSVAIKNDPSASKHPADKILDVQRQFDFIWYQTSKVFKGFKEPRAALY